MSSNNDETQSTQMVDNTDITMTPHSIKREATVRKNGANITPLEERRTLSQICQSTGNEAHHSHSPSSRRLRHFGHAWT